MKKIKNIVFYVYYEGTEPVKKSCVFYNDGTATEGTFADGVAACKEVTKELNITSIDYFKEMFNKNIVYTMSGEEFRKQFNSFIVNEETEVKEAEEEVINEPVEEEKDAAVADETIVPEETVADTDIKPIILPVEPVVEPTEDTTLVDETNDESDDSDSNEDELEDEVIEDGIEPMTQSDGIEDDDLVEDKEEEQEKEGFFKRIFKKIGKKLTRFTAFVTGIVLLLTAGGCAVKNLKTKEGKMTNSNISASDTVEDEKTLDKLISNVKDLDTNNNKDYNDYTVDQLLFVTHDNQQAKAMTNTYNSIRKFNGDFSRQYVEADKTVNGNPIRAALSFEEITALQQAYNDYDKNAIKAIFNGTEVDALKMTRNYKDASLQLMAAYAMESPDKAIDLSDLLETKTGKEFYEKYHSMFLAIKEEKTYEGKSAKATEFFKAVREDFPITEEIRTEGIAHADAYSKIESYKLSVTPMIAAAEMMYQNLETDVTLDDSEIDFLNDIGLCNYADDKFERIETITLAAEEDKTNPTYEQFRNATIAELTSDKNYSYVIDDETRELTKLDAFQKAVNWHFEIVGEGTYEESSNTYQTVTTWTRTSTSYRTEETRVEKPITDQAKKEVDAAIDAENEAAKQKAESEAETKRQELQGEADKESEKIKQEVEKENQDLEEKIEEANEQIKKNNDDDPTNDKPIYEDDLGHGVEFDDDHSDGNGKLNDSVENITTDGTGAVKHDDPLPNPEDTGAKFDAQAGTFYGDNGYTFSGEVYEYNTPTYSDAVDSYVENLAGDEYNYEGYQYTYSN